MAFPFMSHTLNAFPEPPSQSRLSSRSSTSLSSRTSHIPSYPDSLSRPQSAIPPRPSRSNSYLGLCKGAWSVQESLTSGLRLVSVSEGYSHSKRIWRCRTCGFSGPAVPIRYGKGWGVDESIKEVKVFLDDIQGFLGGLESEASQTASGTKEVTARYRWMLLVKSHVKQKAATVGKHCGESAYKCLLCCAEGKETEGYKDVEMLLRHLVSAHGERGGPTEKAEGINCVVGGKADGLEDWDVNIVLDD
ncbi:hypothetical protein P152DRAFT_473434 [Eremomyces bilateralis CBS 781.70]|uniref:Uncharacterized protein n=1 Tax=Eremomyces bilateralis CBS 781.70 TaxID=1392243 RepID=A0A6G1G4I2_9PEZI|nr:uncharacterized protein P152DRAFT_473434 [Eremomyces bilateralis CBS 781.70]KAF1812902.1 hypothetical protein P152DRAFT_473434 [Eremomyces bilateralis CBS 781.70]